MTSGYSAATPRLPRGYPPSSDRLRGTIAKAPTPIAGEVTPNLAASSDRLRGTIAKLAWRPTRGEA